MTTGPERRRRWSDEERLHILTKAFAPGASVLAVARRLNIPPHAFTRGVTSCGTRLP
ncbi:transposase [Sphingobium xenophagum]|uniref:transposase n=1 Tax=Sphingobium xenophagum TaxID=121428 RepID=UPI0013EED6C7